MTEKLKDTRLLPKKRWTYALKDTTTEETTKVKQIVRDYVAFSGVGVGARSALLSCRW